MRSKPVLAALAAATLVFSLGYGCSKKKKGGDDKSGDMAPAGMDTMDPPAMPAPMTMDPPAMAADPMAAMTGDGMDGGMQPDPTIPAKGQAAAWMILIQWKGVAADDKITRTKDQAKQLADKVRADAAKKPDVKSFKALHKKHSSGGGELAPFGPKDVSEFVAKAVFALKKGEVSKVVPSPAGFHIFLRTK